MHERFLDELADHLAWLRTPHPTRVGIDGVDGVGKTTLADALAARLIDGPRQVIRAGIDSFHHPRARRYRRGRHDPEGYLRDSFNVYQLRTLLLEPLGLGGSRRFRRAAFDHRADQPVDAPWEFADPDAILLFDGVFLQQPDLDGALDHVIFLDAPFEITVARCAERDGAPADVDAPEHQRCVGGQRLYLRRDDPRGRADVLVNYSDLGDPRVVFNG